MRLALIATLACALAPSAACSIVVATNAQRPALRVDAKGNAEVSWTHGGRRQTLLIPVRGAALPGATITQTDVSRAVSGPALPFLRVLRAGRGGWYYALQSWQPVPTAPAELHFARWRGSPTTARMTAQKSVASDVVMGTVTFAGKPIPTTWNAPDGNVMHPFVFLDSLVGGEWKRVGGTAPAANGSYQEVVPYNLIGDRFRATIEGPNIGATYAPDATAFAPAP
jgi:hypothetical protein